MTGARAPASGRGRTSRSDGQEARDGHRRRRAEALGGRAKTNSLSEAPGEGRARARRPWRSSPAFVVVVVILFGGGGGHRTSCCSRPAASSCAATRCSSAASRSARSTTSRSPTTGQAEVDDHRRRAAPRGHDGGRSARPRCRASPTATSRSRPGPNNERELADGATLDAERHHRPGRPRPALQHPRRRDAGQPAEGDPGLGDALRREHRGGPRRLQVLRPGPAVGPAPARRADPRRAHPQRVPRLRRRRPRRRRRAPRRPLGADRERQRGAGRDRGRERVARPHAWRRCRRRCARRTRPSSTCAPRSTTSTRWSRPRSPRPRTCAPFLRDLRPVAQRAVPVVSDLRTRGRHARPGQRPDRRAAPRAARSSSKAHVASTAAIEAMDDTEPNIEFVRAVLARPDGGDREARPGRPPTTTATATTRGCCPPASGPSHYNAAHRRARADLRRPRRAADFYTDHAETRFDAARLRALPGRRLAGRRPTARRRSSTTASAASATPPTS